MKKGRKLSIYFVAVLTAVSIGIFQQFISHNDSEIKIAQASNGWLDQNIPDVNLQKAILKEFQSKGILSSSSTVDDLNATTLTEGNDESKIDSNQGQFAKSNISDMTGFLTYLNKTTSKGLNLTSNNINDTSSLYKNPNFNDIGGLLRVDYNKISDLSGIMRKGIESPNLSTISAERQRITISKTTSEDKIRIKNPLKIAEKDNNGIIIDRAINQKEMSNLSNVTYDEAANEFIIDSSQVGSSRASLNWNYRYSEGNKKTISFDGRLEFDITNNKSSQVYVNYVDEDNNVINSDIYDYSITGISGETKQVKKPDIPGYTFDSFVNADDAEGNIKLGQRTGRIITVKYKQNHSQPNITQAQPVHIEYVDDKGNTIADRKADYSINGNIGDIRKISIKSFDNFKFSRVVNLTNQTVVLNNEERTVYVVYESTQGTTPSVEEPVKLNVKYVDQNNQSLNSGKNDYVINGFKNDKVSIQAPEFKNFIFEKYENADSQGKIVLDKDTTVKVIYSNANTNSNKWLDSEIPDKKLQILALQYLKQQNLLPITATVKDLNEDNLKSLNNMNDLFNPDSYSGMGIKDLKGLFKYNIKNYYNLDLSNNEISDLTDIIPEMDNQSNFYGLNVKGDFNLNNNHITDLSPIFKNGKNSMIVLGFYAMNQTATLPDRQSISSDFSMENPIKLSREPDVYASKDNMKIYVDGQENGTLSDDGKTISWTELSVGSHEVKITWDCSSDKLFFSGTLTFKLNIPHEVIVHYVNEAGEKLLPDEVIDGKYNDNFDTTSDQLRKKINHYQLDVDKLPINAIDQFDANVHEITYVYELVKDNSNPSVPPLEPGLPETNTPKMPVKPKNPHKNEKKLPKTGEIANNYFIVLGILILVVSLCIKSKKME